MAAVAPCCTLYTFVHYPDSFIVNMFPSNVIVKPKTVERATETQNGDPCRVLKFAGCPWHRAYGPNLKLGLGSVQVEVAVLPSESRSI